MPTILSRLARRIETWSFKYNCYEAVHPWTPYCSDGALDIGSTVFFEAIKLYTPLYLFNQFMRRRYDGDSFKETGRSVFRSTSFISTNAYLAILFFCSSQKITGKFYYYFAAYLPAFVASAMAILIERPTRRSQLAFYVANVATETLFRISVARGLIKPVDNGQVYIFTISMAIIMMLAKKNGFENDLLSTVIKIIVGSEEAGSSPRHHHRHLKNHQTSHQYESINSEVDKVCCDDHSDADNLVREGPPQSEIDQHHHDGRIISDYSQQTSDSQYPPSYLGSILKLKQTLVTILYAQHRLCPHKETGSCIYYILKSSSRSFLQGYLLQFCLKTLTKPHLILKNPSYILDMARNGSVVRMGLFCSAFTSLYKMTNCILRWTIDSSSPMNCFIASIVAGPALFMYPSSTISLYVMWKCLEAIFNEAVQRGIIKHKNLFIIFLYAISTSQLFYSAILDPRYMKSGYMSFLDRMSDHRLHLLNRSVLDVFGTDASSGYEDYFPNLHPKFMSAAFQESIWIWLLEHKFPANYIR